MALTNMDTLVQKMAGTRPIPLYKSSLANMAAGIVASLWRATGSPAQAAIPTAAATPDRSTLGALEFPSPGSGESLYISFLDVATSNAGSVLIYDRLAHMGGLSGTVTTAQTVNLSISTAAGQGRCQSDGSDVEWYLEWYADTGSTAVTATVSYTNENNVSGRTTTVSLAATRRAGMCLQITPASGDKYIKSVETVTLSASTGTAGNFGVTVRKRLGSMGCPIANISFKSDPFQIGLPLIQPTSCVEFLIACTTTSTGNLTGLIQVISA